MANSTWRLAARDLDFPGWYWVEEDIPANGLLVLAVNPAFLPNLVWWGEFVVGETWEHLLAEGWIEPD